MVLRHRLHGDSTPSEYAGSSPCGDCWPSLILLPLPACGGGGSAPSQTFLTSSPSASASEDEVRSNDSTTPPKIKFKIKIKRGRPWLQDARLAAECAESNGVNSLAVDRASGNNPVWLSHATDLDPRPVRAADAAWYLLAWLYYERSGNTISRTVDGRSAFNMTAGPLRSRISFHPLGRNLFESLITGIPYPGGHDENYLAPDLAPWEDSAASDPLGNPPTRRGLSGVLAGRFRHALLLTPSADGTQVTDVRITWAWRLPHSPSEDPYLIYETPKGKAVASARRAGQRHPRRLQPFTSGGTVPAPCTATPP